MVDDLISRQGAIDLIMEEPSEARYPVYYAEKIRQLPPAQPETCEGCKHLGKWENEVECGYPSPCTRCKRRTGDHYER